jgi:transcriptional regulator with XRE-family HTH domain
MPKNSRITENDKRIGNRVRARRLELGLSQTALGNSLGLTFQQIQKYENGANAISSTRVLALCKSLKVPSSYFFGEDAKGIVDDDQNAMMEMLTTTTAQRVLRAFAGLQSQPMRLAIVEIVELIAKCEKAGIKGEGRAPAR